MVIVTSYKKQFPFPTAYSTHVYSAESHLLRHSSVDVSVMIVLASTPVIPSMPQKPGGGVGLGIAEISLEILETLV